MRPRSYAAGSEGIEGTPNAAATTIQDVRVNHSCPNDFGDNPRRETFFASQYEVC